jgi:sulfatase modifying factor 1
MGLQPVILFLIIFSCLLPGIAGAVPQEGDRLTAPYLSGTVRVRTDSEEGFGFIVGERAGDLYIVTAAHVVEEKAPGRPIQVRLYFYVDQAKGVPAEVLLREPYLDAALLRVTRPPRVEWSPRSYCTPPFERGEQVWFIGRDRGWYVPLDYEAGRLPWPEPDFRGRIPLSIGSVKRGTSGAPLIGRRGLIGMITDDAGVNASALAIRNLRLFVTYPYIRAQGAADRGRPVSGPGRA